MKYIQPHSNTKNCTCKQMSTLLSLFVCALTLSAMMLVGGLYTMIEYQPLGGSDTILAHPNDTILLAKEVDTFSHSNVTVTQCLKEEDDYHDSDIYLIKSGTEVLKRTILLVRSGIFHQDLPTFKAGVQNYLYLLPESSFTYRMCLASTTNQQQTAIYYLFDDIVKYWNYVDDRANGKSYSILFKTLTAGGNNRTTCSEISYNITKASYYFMMVNSPADITYSYNFTLDKVEYDMNGSQSSCRVSDYNQCHLSLVGGDFKHTKYDVIAYVRPSPYEQSIITHLCVSQSTGSSTLSKLALISDALFAVAAVLSFTVTALFISHLIMQRYKRSGSVSERQKLLQY